MRFGRAKDRDYWEQWKYGKMSGSSNYLMILILYYPEIL
jgi:hypothetical protein